MPSNTGRGPDSDTTELRGRRWRVAVPTALAYAVLLAVAGGVVDTVRRLDRIEAKIDATNTRIDTADRIAEVRRVELERRLSALELR
jgi:uncharacterized protein (DUF3084 family)